MIMSRAGRSVSWEIKLQAKQLTYARSILGWICSGIPTSSWCRLGCGRIHGEFESSTRDGKRGVGV